MREAIRQLTVLFASRKVNLLNASIEKVTEAITLGHLGMIESTPTGNETLEIRVCISGVSLIVKIRDLYT